MQCGTTRQLKLRVKIHWNNYWLTTPTPTSSMLAIYNIVQQPKPKGAGHDTWLTCSQPLVDISKRDCKVQVQGLHPDLDGVHQVDKVDVQAHKIAIKVHVFSEAQKLDLQLLFADRDMQQPSLCKVQQISHSLVLHNSSVASMTVTEPTGQEVRLSALEKFWRQSIPSAQVSQQSTPPQLHTPSPARINPEGHSMLPSVVADQQPYRRRRLDDRGTGVADKVNWCTAQIGKSRSVKVKHKLHTNMASCRRYLSC